MRRVLPVLTLFVALMSGLAACRSEDPRPAAERPVTWARPVNVTGIANLYRVSSTLYRSEQPEREGLETLARAQPLESGVTPVKTVVSLREFHDSDGEVFGEKSSALRYERIPFIPARPNTEDVIKFLRIVTTPSMTPVLVHCQHGADRTGMMVATYRIVVEGWSKEDAIAEMKEGGFGFHPVWGDIPAFVNDLDIEAVRKRVAELGSWK